MTWRGASSLRDFSASFAKILKKLPARDGIFLVQRGIMHHHAFVAIIAANELRNQVIETLLGKYEEVR